MVEKLLSNFGKIDMRSTTTTGWGYTGQILRIAAVTTTYIMKDIYEFRTTPNPEHE